MSYIIEIHHFQQYFILHCCCQFHWWIQRKPLTFCKSLTNLITYKYTLSQEGFNLTYISGDRQIAKIHTTKSIKDLDVCEHQINPSETQENESMKRTFIVVLHVGDFHHCSCIS